VAQSPPASGRASFIWFSELERWILLRRSFDASKLPKGWQSVRIGDVVSQVTARETVQPDKEYRMAGVKWYAEGAFHRETVLGKEMSAKHVVPLVPGAVIYSRLFAWKESFAVVGAAHTGLYVSGEFPQFTVDTARVMPEFVYLFCTQPKTIEMVNAASVGSAAVSRNRFKEEEFLKLEMPLPPLAEQRAIVERWRSAQAQIAAAENLMEKPRQRLSEYLHSVTNTEPFEQRSLKLSWAELESWDVKSSRAAAFRLANPSFKPFGEYAEEATELVKPSLAPEKDWPVYGVNNVDGVFFSHHQKGAEFNAAYKRIRKDWFFHNPTRSSVGSLGIVPAVEEDAITSPEYQVWRIREECLIPDFVAVLVTTEFFIKLIQFHRVGAVKQRLYVENLLAIPIPEVPKRIQREIANARQAALGAIREARERTKQVSVEIEALILGGKL
jgi:hypothetical protein